MKSELWPKVKRGDYLIYADEDDGVQKVKVVEIDITIEVFEPEYKKEQPYGLTAETGNIRILIQKNGKPLQIIENLASLIRFNLSWYNELRNLLSQYGYYKGLAEERINAFTGKRAEYRLA